MKAATFFASKSPYRMPSPAQDKDKKKEDDGAKLEAAEKAQIEKDEKVKEENKS